jgi:hypothetical protein
MNNFLFFIPVSYVAAQFGFEVRPPPQIPLAQEYGFQGPLPDPAYYGNNNYNSMLSPQGDELNFNSQFRYVSAF